MPISTLIFACEDNPPLNQDGMSCFVAGKPYLEHLHHAAAHCKAIMSRQSLISTMVSGWRMFKDNRQPDDEH